MTTETTDQRLKELLDDVTNNAQYVELLLDAKAAETAASSLDLDDGSVRPLTKAAALVAGAVILLREAMSHAHDTLSEEEL